MISVFLKLNATTLCCHLGQIKGGWTDYSQPDTCNSYGRVLNSFLVLRTHHVFFYKWDSWLSLFTKINYIKIRANAPRFRSKHPYLSKNIAQHKVVAFNFKKTCWTRWVGSLLLRDKSFSYWSIHYYILTTNHSYNLLVDTEPFTKSPTQ
jgi:hypothetical protein